MKLTVERLALVKMIGQLKVEREAKGRREITMRLSACAARVFVEANGVTAGVEALVLEDGACTVPRMKFLKVLKTFAPKQNITIYAQGDILRVEGFGMKVTDFSPAATAPGEFQIFPVTDTWVAQPESPKPAPPTESRFLKTRWWE